jgi:hypothetical protein
MDNIVETIDYIKTYWWQLLLALIFGFTLISMIIKFFLEKITLFIVKIISFVITLPIKLLIYFPKMTILLILGTCIYFLLK